MPQISPLAPIDPSSVTVDKPDSETEKKAPWIVRKLIGSMPGRIVMSSYESLKAAGTSVVCLSPWGDSNPIFLPCVRFRDLAVHAVVVGTGGIAVVAAPVIGPISETVINSIGDSLAVEVGLNVGFEASTKVVNDLLLDYAIKHAIPAPSARLQTTGIKELLITLKYKHTLEDAQLGFFRSSVHEDDTGGGLFSDVTNYFSSKKGWFNPYLFASGRRPIIPRSMKPDIIFCHGPFLEGDYKIGTLLLHESASMLMLCDSPSDPEDPDPDSSKSNDSSLLDHLHVPVPPRPRRLDVLALVIAPHRAGMWTTSARPGESALRYTLLNGCPVIVLPARAGAPLIAWDTLPLDKLYELKDQLPPEEGSATKSDGNAKGGSRFRDALDVLTDKDSKEVKDKVDVERGGIVIFRIP